MIINNKSSKPRFETPDRTRDQFENMFLKRLSFLKNLLSDGNPGNEQKENDINGYSLGKLSSLFENKPNLINYSPRRGEQ